MSAFQKTDLTSPVRYLKGVGEKTAVLLARLEIRRIEDLFYFFPRRYEDRRALSPLDELCAGENAAAEAEVLSLSAAEKYHRVPVTALLSDGTATVRAIWFNPHVAKSLAPGVRLALYGRVEFYRGLQFNNPEFEVLNGSPPSLVGRIVAVYPAVAPLTQKRLKKFVDAAFEAYSGGIVDFLPRRIRERYRMKGLLEALVELHRPGDEENWLRARNRLAFDELFLLQTGLALRQRGRADSALSRASALTPGTGFRAFKASLPFSLTNAQERVIGEIFADLRGPLPMNRLLQGDVGSGKTLVALAAFLAAADSGAQSALMVPTEVLAQQHYIRIKKMLDPLGVATALLTGSAPASERRAVLEDLRAGKIDVLIGTHALFTGKVTFANLGLVVVDEQHRFGVLQKNALIAKAASPHVLVMTATPIPRTLVLSVYGDLSVSNLDELPPGRKPIRTVSMKADDEPTVLNILRKCFQKGQQAYWICPLIEEGEGRELENVLACYDRLSRLLDARMAVMHGRLSLDEKAEVMRRFAAGEIDLLVATVIVEVGLDIPNASVMVISDAGQFGLAQLHQLRGRVGRGDANSLCVLLEGRTTTPEGRIRMETMVHVSDGFALAEADLEQRGPGEVCGVRQHGVTDFRVANLLKDQKLLELARRESQELLKADPDLASEPLLRAELMKRLGEGLNLAGTA